jgi:hypothetical protein
MENGSLSPSDIALLNGNGAGGWGESSFMWIFALLILFGGFGGWGGAGNAAFANAIGYENLATSNEVQRGFDNQNSMANQREILAAVNSGTAQAVAATNQSFHDNLAAEQAMYNETARDIAALAVGQADLRAALDSCCCSTKMAIMESTAGIQAGIAQNRYDAALNTAAINANTTAQVQKVLDTIQGNRIDELQNKVNQLELMNATANVVRYPSASTYYAGTNPFCGGGCGCGGFAA